MWPVLALLLLACKSSSSSPEILTDLHKNNTSATATTEQSVTTDFLEDSTQKFSMLQAYTLYEDEELVLTCPYYKNKKVQWYKDNKTIPIKGRFSSNKLIVPRVTIKDSGKFTCRVGKNEYEENFFVTVKKKSSKYSTSNVNFFKDKITTLGLPTVTIPKSTEAPSLETQYFFECTNGERVNKSLRCDHNNDCKDASDEKNCEFFHPKITVLPDLHVELVCGTDETDISETLKLVCEFSGHPEPVVKWKRYDNHVPSKCQQISEGGRGTLICHNFKQLDQGAYSCVGENSEGSGQSQPKSVVKCKNYIHCKGFKVLDEDQLEHCLDCFCSGKSTECENIKSKPFFTTIYIPDCEVEVFAKENGEIVFIPSSSQIVPNGEVREIAKPISYWEVSADYIKEDSLLKSYGRKLRLPKPPKTFNKNKFIPEAPDLIITGNDITLLYSFNDIPNSLPFVDVKLWQGNWVHLNKTHATRNDIMTLLSDFQTLLIRCEYKEGVTEIVRSKTITLETSYVANSTISASYLEKCKCPLGYAGLSCENCADGYEKIRSNNSFTCKHKSCEHAKGYYWDENDCKKSLCDIEGSLSLKPDQFGNCQCKENVIGKYCDKCKNGYFNVKGCLKCFCSGVSDICSSSTLRRTILSSTAIGGYNASSNSVSSGKNFWLLPSLFTGNRLASYGGFLKYGMEYRPNIKKQQSVLSVELLTAEDFTLTYTHPDVDTTTSENVKSWKVDLTERYWKKADGRFANRSEFLEVLSKLKAIYIESPYHLAYKLVNLTWVHMSDAKNISDPDAEVAYEVEKCECPTGYKGLSCEECEEGYIKVKNSNLCMPCDPQKGCSDCPKGHFRSNPESEKIPICKKCNCNGNEEKCGVDINNKPYCICKSGYGGFNCENQISVRDSHLIVQIIPGKLSVSQLGSMVTFNCSYDSSDEMTLSFTKVFPKSKKGPIIEPIIPLNSVKSKFGSAMIWKTDLETDLIHVECNVNNLKGKEVGKVIAVVDKIVQPQVPVKITNCFSNTITVKETKSQDMICTATGTPEPEITWYVKLENGTLEKVDTVDGVHSIDNAKLEQNGTEYICQAKNEIHDMQSCTFTLIVTKNCDEVHIVPKSLTVNEGETILLKCTTTSNNTVSWSGLNFVLPFSRKEENGVLTINDAKTSLNGIYVCKVWSDGKYINNTVNVTVIEKKIPPTAHVSQSDANLKVGDNFDVLCWGTGKPIPQVSWLKHSISNNNVIIHEGKLNIYNATLENSGIFECQANSSEGSHIRRLYINVTETRVKPKIIIEPYHSTVIEGSNVTLKCIIKEGIPRPTVYWSKYDRGQFLPVKPSGIVQENGTVLFFQNISRRDSATYICRARNIMGEDEGKREIVVMYKPEITFLPEEISVYENEDITVTCYGTGNPVPDLTIESRKKSAKKRFAGKTNKLAKMDSPEKVSVTIKAESDLEALICVGSNSVGVTKKEIRLIITATSEATTDHAIRVPLGSYHEIMCYNCSGKLKWEKSSLSKSKKSLVGDECDIKNGLKIESVQIQHGGTYICTCDNDPKFRKEFTLIVYGYAPQFVQKSDSYLIVPNNFKSSEKLKLEIYFKTNKNNGMLLYHENHKFLVYIHNLKVVVALFSDTVTSAFSSDKKLNYGTFYSLVVDIKAPTVVMTIYDEKADIFEKKTEENFFTSEFDFGSHENLFVGGMNRIRPTAHDLLPRHFSSLDGCITRLNINNREFDIVKEGNYSSGVSLCNRCSREKDPCEGKGQCINAPTHFGFVCVCPEPSTIKDYDACPKACNSRNCDGQLDLCELLKPCNDSNSNGCSSRWLSSLECHCNIGFSGSTCNDEQQHTICFKEDGYAELPSRFLYRSNLAKPQTIVMEFYMKEPNGLLLFQGNKENFISISVRDRVVKYEFVNQNRKLHISTEPISLNAVHKLAIERSNGTAVLTLDSEILEDRVDFTTDRIDGHIFIGGLSKNYHFNFPYYKHEGLNGGILYIKFGDRQKINFRKDAFAVVNDKPCESLNEILQNGADYEESGDGSYYDSPIRSDD